MFERLLTVKYITSKSSFCCVSLNNWKALQGNSLKVVYNENQEAYFSVDGSAAIRNDEIIGINSLYAKVLGISENSIVTISEIPKPPTIQSVAVVAINNDDHNILEMLAETVQSTLLQQIRVLSNNQKIIIWIGNSIHVSVNVCDIKPMSPGRIDNFTEVIIKPPGEQRKDETKHLKNILKISASEDFFTKFPKTDELILRAVPYNELKIPKDFAQPFNVFVLKSCIKSLIETNTCINPQMFSIKIVKPNDIMSRDEAFVRLYALEDINDELSVNFKELVCTENVFVSNAIIEDFNCDMGSRFLLKMFTEQIPVVNEIQIFAKKNHSSNVEEVFRNYLIDSTQRHHSLILNKEFNFCIGENLRVLLRFQPVEAAFCSVDNGFADSSLKISFFKENLETKDVKDNVLFSRHQFITKISNYQEIIDDSLFLLLGNFRRKLCEFNNILITGKVGTGKTTCLNIIQNLLNEYPNFIYTKNLNCKSIKGKTLESLHKQFYSIFYDLIHHQPAVLILDNLHILCENVNESDALAQNALYFNRISEMLENLFQHFCKGNSIGILASSISTTKLNKHIYTTRGNHLFKNVFTIRDLTKIDRKEALEFFFSSYKLRDVNLSTFSEKTESFVIQDLADFCHKTLFESYEDDPTQSSITITGEHCKNALETVSVSSLEGVKLQVSDGKDFTDIGGLETVKKLIIEVMLWPSKHPNLFDNSPLRLPSGLLLYGPPGTGKTILAAAAARHCGLRLISIKGPELLSKYIGASEQAVRDIFQRAQSVKPCVLFFDEFDSLAPRRGHDNTGVTDRVVNQLLTQLDGVESLSGVFILAATSRPDLLDPALLRPGRLDRHIRCALPNREEREQILKALSKSLKFSDAVDLGEIADCSSGFSGADLQAVLYSAQLESVRGLLEDEENNSGEELFTEINHNQLMEAVIKTRPSITNAEKMKYQRIYQRFEEGSNDEFSAGSRTTLA